MRLSDLGSAARLSVASSADRVRAWGHRLQRLPLAWPDPSLQVAADAVRLGSRFLSSRQGEDGSLRGFQLAPGASVEWVTAHVALVTEPVAELAEMRRKAAQYLLGLAPLDAGWGYNRRVGRDLDSTTQALMVCEDQELEAPGFIHDWVRDNQQPDGSFPTYATSDASMATGWHASHPEVTQMAAWYFRRRGDEGSYRKCLQWLNDAARPGERPSYWWPGYGYSLWLDRHIEPDAPLAARAVEELSGPHGAPQLGFALGSAVGILDRDLIEGAMVRLLAQQLADGSWPCGPCLRVTARTVNHAAPSAPGTVAADPYRVFSTAHCVAAITAAHLWLLNEG